MKPTSSSKGPELPAINEDQEAAASETLSSHRAREIALSDPLKAETRKARLYLLGVSIVGITLVYTGLVPQEITALGITFGEADRKSLLRILSLVIAYFLAAFAIYGVSDFLAWRSAFKVAFIQEENAKDMLRMSDDASKRHLAKEFQRRKEELQKEAEDTEKELLETLGKAGDDGPKMDELRKRAELLRMRAESAPATPVLADRVDVVLADMYRPVSLSVSWARALFEFLLPLLVGFYVIYALLSA